MNKAERLELAGYIAPALRSSKAAGRRVAVCDADGNVVRWTTIGEVQESLLARQKIELAVEEGVRPETVFCKICGKAVTVAKIGPVPTRCSIGCSIFCSCGKKLSKYAGQSLSRKNITNKCKECSYKELSNKFKKERLQKSLSRPPCKCGKLWHCRGLCYNCYRREYNAKKRAECKDSQKSGDQ